MLMSIFDPVLMLEAIQRYKITSIGAVPTMYRFLWAVPNYKEYDLSSLKFVIYAGLPSTYPS